MIYWLIKTYPRVYNSYERPNSVRKSSQRYGTRFPNRFRVLSESACTRCRFNIIKTTHRRRKFARTIIIIYAQSTRAVCFNKPTWPPELVQRSNLYLIGYRRVSRQTNVVPLLCISLYLYSVESKQVSTRPNFGWIVRFEEFVTELEITYFVVLGLKITNMMFWDKSI